MKLSDFNFVLPQDLIAQHPLPRRDQSRMMVVWRESGMREHRMFRELSQILTPENFLVVNNTRVFPARLEACRAGKDERIEVLLTQEKAPGVWLALLRPARKAPLRQILEVAGLDAVVEEVRDSGLRLLRFGEPQHVLATLEREGQPPLPPYIHRQAGESTAEDRERYQTVFAKHIGSVAAPTAGLHFTPEMLSSLEEQGIQRCEILLHVGYGTFKPVRASEIEAHHMDPEYFEVAPESAACIFQKKWRGKRLIAVGTSTTRALEHLAREKPFPLHGARGWCDLFIYPGFRFRIIDGLLTNFHLPGSTLLMLVCALAGTDLVLECYREAVAQRYRFFSYGDCMLIL